MHPGVSQAEIKKNPILNFILREEISACETPGCNFRKVSFKSENSLLQIFEYRESVYCYLLDNQVKYPNDYVM